MNNKRWSKMHALQKRLGRLISSRTKAILLSVAASLLIGILFGMISLQMAEKDSSRAETKNTSVDIANGTEKNATLKSFEPFTFYVIQAGVFTDSNNAQKWANLYDESGYPTIEWEREEE